MEFKIERDSNYLAHHGIAGQKWGKRNGPPYPLDYGDHSAAEKKNLSRYEFTGYKGKDEKILKKTYEEAKYAKAAREISSRKEKELREKAKNAQNAEKRKNYESEAERQKKINELSKENAKYFSQKYQRQAKEFFKKYGQQGNGGKNIANARYENIADRTDMKRAGKYFVADNLGAMLLLPIAPFTSAGLSVIGNASLATGLVYDKKYKNYSKDVLGEK